MARKTQFAALLPLAMALGCTQSAQQTLTFTAAPEAECGGSAEWLQAQVRCVHVTVCGSVGGECAEVSLRDPITPGRTELLLSLGGSTLFDFAVRPVVGVTEYDIDVIAYGDTVGGANPVLARGRATRVSLGSGTLNLLLSPVRETATNAWSCPGGEGADSIPRAFHQAVALSNGEVLILGGIEGGVLISASSSAGLISGDNVVQVFTPGPDTVQAVRVEGDAATFSRALFDARWIAREGDVERIRLFGGVTGTGRVAFLLNDLTQGPIAAMPGSSAPAPVVDVLYNPADHTIRVASTVSGISTTAVETQTAAPPFIAQPSQGVYGTTATEGRFAVVSATMSTVDVSTVARRGQTLSRLGTGWLVYGGNLGPAMGMREAGRFAVFSATGAVVPTVFPASITNSAFHTATAVGDALLFVGGIGLDNDNDAAPFVLPSAATGAPVRGLRSVGTTLEALTGTIVDPESERSFHTATLDTRGRVLVVGGSVVRGTRLQATGSAYAVSIDASGRMSQSAVSPLRHPRFGHAATLLSTGRLLVTGGLVNATDASMRATLALVDEPEMLYVGPQLLPVVCGEELPDAGSDARMSTDAGPALDAPTSDAPSSDAPGPDAPGPDAHRPDAPGLDAR